MSDREEQKANLIGAAFKSKQELEAAAAQARTSDTNTVRVGSQDLERWAKALHDTLFRLRSEIE